MTSKFSPYLKRITLLTDSGIDTSNLSELSHSFITTISSETTTSSLIDHNFIVSISEESILPHEFAIALQASGVLSHGFEIDGILFSDTIENTFDVILSVPNTDILFHEYSISDITNSTTLANQFSVEQSLTNILAHSFNVRFSEQNFILGSLALSLEDKKSAKILYLKKVDSTIVPVVLEISVLLEHNDEQNNVKMIKDFSTGITLDQIQANQFILIKKKDKIRHQRL